MLKKLALVVFYSWLAIEVVLFILTVFDLTSLAKGRYYYPLNFPSHVASVVLLACLIIIYLIRKHKKGVTEKPNLKIS